VLNKTRNQLLTFALIGGVGFAIDGGVLTLLATLYGANIYASRLVSFTVATLATWWLNRRHTFGLKSAAEIAAHAHEYARYVAVQVGGGLLNLAIFSWLIYLDPGLRSIPILPLAIGAAAGLVWNFIGARLWVYRT
jgi:putative flippase GtrA